MVVWRPDPGYVGGMRSAPLIRFLTRYLSRLRFPQLFAITAVLFVVDVLVPDFIPFVDEVLLALATLLLGSWKKHRTGAVPGDQRSSPPVN